MAERSSPTGSAVVESSRTFPERENPHGRGRGCPDASDGGCSLGGATRALPSELLRSFHHPDPHTERTARPRRHTTGNSAATIGGSMITHPSRSFEAPDRDAGASELVVDTER